MKQSTKYYIILFIIFTSIIYTVCLNTLYNSSLNYVLAESKNIFDDVIDIDRDARYDETGEVMHFIYIPHDTSTYLVTEMEGHEPIYREKTDSIRQLTYEVRIKSATQSYLYYKNPINVYTLDSLFQIELLNKKIVARTFIIYSDNKTGKTYYSDNDSTFSNEFKELDVVDLGYKELTLQAFVNVLPTTIIRKSLLPICSITFIWLLLIGIAAHIFYKIKIKKAIFVKFTVQLKKTDID